MAVSRLDPVSWRESFAVRMLLRIMCLRLFMALHPAFVPCFGTTSAGSLVRSTASCRIESDSGEFVNRSAGFAALGSAFGNVKNAIDPQAEISNQLSYQAINTISFMIACLWLTLSMSYLVPIDGFRSKIGARRRFKEAIFRKTRVRESAGPCGAYWSSMSNGLCGSSA